MSFLAVVVEARKVAEIINDFIASGARAYVRRGWREIARVEVRGRAVYVRYADGDVAKYAPDAFLRTHIVIDITAPYRRRE
jgi:hypothetical protein